MSRPRKNRFAGWMKGLYRKEGRRSDLYYCLQPHYISLGHDISEARRMLAELQRSPQSPLFIGGLLDEFVAHRKELNKRHGRPAASTIAQNEIEANWLKKNFGHMRLTDLQTVHIWTYLHRERGAAAPVRANREVSLLSSAFRYALNRGYTNANPCANVEKNKETPRTRAVSFEELESFCQFISSNQHHAANSSKRHSNTGGVIALACRLAFLTAKAESQILNLTESDIHHEGISFSARKHGHATLVQWTPLLRETIKDLRALRPGATCEHLVTNGEGKPYTLSGFITVFRRSMKGWVAAGASEGRLSFTFHDLRAMAITYLKEQGRDAKELSGHTSDLVPNRVYDRRRMRVAKAVR